MKPLKQQSEIRLNTPNLPETDVTSVLINYKAIKSVTELKKYGIYSLKINDNDNIKCPVSSHADINICQIGNKIFYFDNINIAGELSDFYKTELCTDSAKNEYPYDSYLNCVQIGNNLICNEKTVSRQIIEEAYCNNLNIINVNQGYTKCSVCPVTEEFIITDDESIYKASVNVINKVLLISKGSIKIDGYNYGFIGGATGKIAKDKLAFNGSLETHPDHNIIADALFDENIEIIELTDEPLTDIGSIIPILQKNLN